nr:MAG TPA: hypothetical protein [Caudoviricetes sp.]
MFLVGKFNILKVNGVSCTEMCNDEAFLVGINADTFQYAEFHHRLVSTWDKTLVLHNLISVLCELLRHFHELISFHVAICLIVNIRCVLHDSKENDVNLLFDSVYFRFIFVSCSLTLAKIHNIGCISS